MWKASYTVEVALLFPFILGVIIFSMGLNFYIYNLSVMQMEANELAIAGEYWFDFPDGSIKRELVELGKETLGDSLIAVKDTSVSVDVKNGRITVIYEGNYIFPIVSVFFGEGTAGKKISVKGEAELQNPVSKIRTMRKIGKITEWLGKGDE